MIENIVFGGIYKVKVFQSYNDQQYGYVFPIHCGKDVYMVDTYYLNSPTIKKGESSCEAAKRKIIEYSEQKDCSWLIKRIRWDYYHQNYTKIDPDDINSFYNYEFICDLRKVRPLSINENIEDFLEGFKGVILYREQNYSWHYGTMGVDLVPKNIEIDKLAKARRLYRDVQKDIAAPYFSEYKFSLFEDYIKENNIHDEDILQKVERCRKMDDLIKEFNKNLRELKRNV